MIDKNHLELTFLILRKESNQSLSSPATFLDNAPPMHYYHPTIHRNLRHSLQRYILNATRLHSASREKRIAAFEHAQWLARSRFLVAKCHEQPLLPRPCCSGDAFHARGGSALTCSLSLLRIRLAGFDIRTASTHSFYRLA